MNTTSQLEPQETRLTEKTLGENFGPSLSDPPVSEVVSKFLREESQLVLEGIREAHQTLLRHTLWPISDVKFDKNFYEPDGNCHPESLLVELSCGPSYDLPIEVLNSLSLALVANRAFGLNRILIVLHRDRIDAEHSLESKITSESHIQLLSEKLMSLVDRFKDYAEKRQSSLKVQVVDSDDIRMAREYEDVVRMLSVKSTETKGIALAHPDRLVRSAEMLTLQRIFGSFVKIGWSRFPSKEELSRNVRRGSVADIGKISDGCDGAYDLWLKRNLPEDVDYFPIYGEGALSATNPYAQRGMPLDVIRPFSTTPRTPLIAMLVHEFGEHGRVLLDSGSCDWFSQRSIAEVLPDASIELRKEAQGHLANVIFRLYKLTNLVSRAIPELGITHSDDFDSASPIRAPLGILREIDQHLQRASISKSSKVALLREREIALQGLAAVEQELLVDQIAAIRSSKLVLG